MVDTASLVEQLITVELSIGHESPPLLRSMLRDIQFALIELQKEHLEMLRELERLRRRKAEPTRTALLQALREELDAGKPAPSSSGDTKGTR
jgi:hypothetical protein